MEMRARVCDLLGKKPNRQARVVTFSHKRIKKVQHVNLQWKRFYSEEMGRNIRLRLSTKGIKTVNKYGGIDAAAKKFDLDLTKHA
jgi:large subunit ribosomal protein L28